MRVDGSARRGRAGIHGIGCFSQETQNTGVVQCRWIFKALQPPEYSPLWLLNWSLYPLTEASTSEPRPKFATSVRYRWTGTDRATVGQRLEGSFVSISTQILWDRLWKSRRGYLEKVHPWGNLKPRDVPKANPRAQPEGLPSEYPEAFR